MPKDSLRSAPRTVAYCLKKGARVHLSRTAFRWLAIIGIPILIISFENFSPVISSQPQPTVTLATCSSNSSETCAEITLPSGSKMEVSISNLTGYTLIDSGLMGTFSRPAGSLGYLYVYAQQGSGATPELNIVDLDAGASVAAASPIGNSTANTYFSFVTDPSGNKYPFLHQA